MLEGRERQGVTASAKCLRELTGQGRHRANDRLLAALEELVDVRFDLPDGRGTCGVSILAGYRLDRGASRITWWVAPAVAWICANLRSVDPAVVRALTSQHALRLYEIGTCYLNRRHRS